MVISLQEQNSLKSFRVAGIVEDAIFHARRIAPSNINMAFESFMRTVFEVMHRYANNSACREVFLRSIWAHIMIRGLNM
jgi:hypothetical protein